MAINNTLKDIREERNLVQADLAAKCLSRNCNPSGTLSENASRRDFSN